MFRISYLFIILTLVFVACQKGSKYYEQADKGYTSEELAETAEDKEAKSVEIVMNNLNYSPSQIEAQAGQLISFTLRNEGNQQHSIVFQLPAGEVGLEDTLSPGESANLEFTAPLELNTYTFYCPIEDHQEQGMKGTLVITAGGEEN
ncbi:MAG: cupredoxin domain-containing protein [Candidatus Cyclobacteriaceae bacterium M3_2C_046]